MPSVWDSPNEQNSRMSVNGVLRTTLTYVVPSQFNIGTGFSDRTLTDLYIRLAPLVQRASPFDPQPKLPANAVYVSEPPRGGHFAPFEEPELYAEELRTFFRPYRTAV